MGYSKECKGMAQECAIENLTAVLTSPYFAPYQFNAFDMSTEMLRSELRNTNQGLNYTVKMSNVAKGIREQLELAANTGSIENVRLEMTPTQQMLGDMKFKMEVFEHEFALPLTFRISSNKVPPQKREHNFHVSQNGLKESYFEAENLDYDHANRIVKQWYRNISHELRRILPYAVTPTRFA